MPSTIRVFTLFILLLAPCFASAEPGPATQQVSLDDFERVIHVSVSSGSADGDGSQAAPLVSVAAALQQMGEGPGFAILVAEGVYTEPELILPAGVQLLGGFEDSQWTRDVWAHRTILDGAGSHRVLVMEDGSALDGFEVANGVVRGAGAGIAINAASPSVTNNFFRSNKTLGPLNWAPKNWHETAHDGGAVYCSGAGAPIIANNLFVENQTENGRGAAIAYDGGCAGEIHENVFVENLTGLDDPARSSDGGAVSVFDHSSPVISNNLFLGNRASSKNDGGGLFVALWSSARVQNNTFVANEAGDDAGALFVGGQEHRYDEPFDPIPPRSEFFVEVTGNHFYGNRNPSRNSGAMRFTMESRGRIAGNISAYNHGVYVQRSEAEIEDNTFVEDLIFIETKEGLEPSTFRRNIVVGAVEYDTQASVTDSLFLEGFPGEGNLTGAPEFIADSMQIDVFGFRSSAPDRLVTLLVPEDQATPGLVGRVVQSGPNWGVIRSAGDGAIEIWGSFDSVTSLSVLPTFRPKQDSMGAQWGAHGRKGMAAAAPGRINKAIELLDRGQPVYYKGAYGGYNEGLALAQTWADIIMYNMEHKPLDFTELRGFMQGLVDGGPTPSGHRTPAVIVVLPLLGLDGEVVRSGGWMVEQALAQGVHGVHLAKARSPKAVEEFVRAARYPIHEQGVSRLGVGIRGWGSHHYAASIWGVHIERYLEIADPWPLNAEGELMLGLKIEDQEALKNVEKSLAVPGIAFTEHGPRDMGLSYGYLEGRADPPVPDEVNAAGDRVLSVANRNGQFFLDNVLPETVEAQLERGVMIGAGSNQGAAELGRELTERKMPW